MSRKDWHRPEVEGPREGYRRIAMALSYDGSLFCGWQRQEGQRTVQQELELALGRMLGKDVIIQGSGRTDSKVHARCQVCHFDIDNPTIPLSAFEKGLNPILPPGIRIHRAWEPEEPFNARFSTMSRTYRYFIKDEASFSAFDQDYFAKVRKLPDLQVMNSYASLVQGTHDFSSFCASGDLSPSKFRDIYISRFDMETDRFGCPMMVYTIAGNAFLYHMVRSLVGTMLSLGQKGIDAGVFAAMLEAKDRNEALETAPSQGLYLWDVSYDESQFAWFEETEDD